MNWLALALYLVGAMVVTMAEGDFRSVARPRSVAPPPKTRVLATEAVVESARRIETVVSAWDVPMGRTQAGVRTDDLEPPR